MPIDTEDMILMLTKVNEQQAATIAGLEETIKTLNATIVNLQEQVESLRQELFGTSSEKTVKKNDDPEDSEKITVDAGAETVVKEHKRKAKKKSIRKDLYKALPIKEVHLDAKGTDRNCPDCGAEMEHLGYRFVREELRVIPARVERVRIMQETLVCPACREELDTTITVAPAPKALLPHSPASPSMVAYVMYEKSCKHMPFYRQEQDWLQKGLPLPRETQANWYNSCAIKYLLPVYELMHLELLMREVIHADEIPCQVLHEPGRDATSKSYMWIYLSGTDGLPPIILYDYQPGRGSQYPIEFLQGFKGMLHCDGYSAYGCIEDVILICCLAHARRKFFDAIPASRRKNFKLLDINSEEILQDPDCSGFKELIPAEQGVIFCNRLFFRERLLKNLPPEEKKQKRIEEETAIWDEFWNWIGILNPVGGSKLEKAVNYAQNHHETLMNYMKDGRCEISNNAAERRAKSYATGRKNFLFHDTVDGALASAIVLSIVETAKANKLNIFQYLYTLLLYMPDYLDKPAGIEQLLPWSDFIKEQCSGIADVESNTIETRIELPKNDPSNL